MGWIVLLSAIICASFLTIIFKFFQKHKVNTSFAIVFNYFIAASLAFIFSNHIPNISLLFSYSWTYAAILLAVLFITLFNLLAFTSQTIGITPSNIANKTSFIFPAIMGIYLFKEDSNWMKILGIITGITAVIFAAREKTKPASTGYSNFSLILILFFGSGLIDLILSYSQKELIPDDQLSIFTGYSFAIAGILGSLSLLFSSLFKKVQIQRRDFIGGFALGIPNYFSIFLFLLALSYEQLESSVTFTVFNMGIIITTAILGAVLFQEQLNLKKITSIVLAVLSIVLVSYYKVFF